MIRIVIIGRAQNRAGGPPLMGQTGERLRRLLGVSREKFAELRRENLLDYYPGRRAGGHGDALDMAEGRARFVELVAKGHLDGARVLVLGRFAAAVFGLDDWFLSQEYGAFTAMAIPHPSGRNHFYNDPKKYKKAAKEARAFLNPEGAEKWPSR